MKKLSLLLLLTLTSHAFSAAENTQSNWKKLLKIGAGVVTVGAIGYKVCQNPTAAEKASHFMSKNVKTIGLSGVGLLAASYLMERENNKADIKKTIPYQHATFFRGLGLTSIGVVACYGAYQNPTTAMNIINIPYLMLAATSGTFYHILQFRSKKAD